MEKYKRETLALAEAMACGCIPVMTKRGALIEVVGNTGFMSLGIFRSGSDNESFKIFRRFSNDARERIKMIFDLKNREIELTKITKAVVKCVR